MSEEDLLLEALRADLPTDRERERVRTRLIAAGALAAAVAPTATVAATSGSLISAGTGLLPKFSALSWVSKLALVAAVSAGVAAPVALVGLSSQAELPAPKVIAPAPRPTMAPLTAAASVTMPEAESAAISPAPQQLAEATTATTLATTVRAPAKRRAAASATPIPAPVQTAQPEAVAEPAASAAAVDVVADAPKERKPEPAPAPNPEATPSAQAGSLPPSAARVKFAVQLPTARSQAVTLSQLAQETKLMERALAALRTRDVTRARGYLDQHALRFYDGLLRRDRERVLERIQKLTDGTTSRVKNERP
ncbi:MAG: hypothetical protein RL701_4036 [Pseudomonadota bacterium]